MPVAKTVNAIKRMRHERGVPQGELASLAGISRQALSDIEAGHSCPSTAVALRLSKSLHCSVEDLFHLAEDREALFATWSRRPQRPVETRRTRDPIGARRQIPAGERTSRVAVGLVAGRWIAHSLAAEHPASTCIAADGLVRTGKGTSAAS